MDSSGHESTARSHAQPKEVFADGAAYEPYVGRWSRVIAREFVTWLNAPPNSDWLDVGCGTGALSSAILLRANPRNVTGADPSIGFISHARKQMPGSRVHFAVGDAQSLPFSSASFDAVVGGLMLNFVPDPRQAVSDMARVCRPGGTVATYVWDYAGQMQFMRSFWDSAVQLDPSAVELDEGRRFSLCQIDPLTALFNDAGLNDVTSREIDIPTIFRDFDDFWLPFLGGQGSAPGYLKRLNADQRLALRERLRQTLPQEQDGSIHLIARAWAVRGSR